MNNIIKTSLNRFPFFTEYLYSFPIFLNENKTFPDRLKFSFSRIENILPQDINIFLSFCFLFEGCTPSFFSFFAHADSSRIKHSLLEPETYISQPDLSFPMKAGFSLRLTPQYALATGNAGLNFFSHIEPETHQTCTNYNNTDPSSFGTATGMLPFVHTIPKIFQVTRKGMI